MFYLSSTTPLYIVYNWTTPLVYLVLVYYVSTGSMGWPGSPKGNAQSCQKCHTTLVPLSTSRWLPAPALLQPGSSLTLIPTDASLYHLLSPSLVISRL
ncbi:hypothetical protein GDO78_017882 [Eleutherodactylus coqui]|uniref:Uncharacterized protein n=1 Tax=Eleutherodactylus coqui TaxID=57060 RepID=A0A8J6BII2_ELECQ|nr:hypothetical protein GDO78_017882 [Eleutherodactylus coqui]